MNKKKILLVEDELFLRDLYVEALTTAGYEVITAVNGQEAYDKLKQGGYDLILLDIVMPIMDGIQVVEKLKEEGSAIPNKYVVFLTNLDNDADIKKALLYGAGYIIKSQITPADLLNEVKHYLEAAAVPAPQTP